MTIQIIVSPKTFPVCLFMFRSEPLLQFTRLVKTFPPNMDFNDIDLEIALQCPLWIQFGQSLVL